MAIMQSIIDAVVGAQTEICIFLLAIAAHLLFFGKHQVGRKPVNKLMKEGPVSRIPVTSSPSGGAAGAASASPAAAGGKSPAVAAAPSAIVKPMQALVSEGASLDAMTKELTRLIGSKPCEERADLLAGLITALGPRGGGGCRELLVSIRRVAEEMKIEATAGLNEMLLRGFIMARAFEDAESLISTVLVGNASSAPAAFRALSLRAATVSGDIDKALDRVRLIAGATTPSAALGQIMTQLVRLSLDKDVLQALVESLKANGLFVGSTIQVLLQETASKERWADFELVKELAAASAVQLTSGCHAALVRAAVDAAAALRSFNEASAAGQCGPEVFIAAASAASRLSDEALATAVVQGLGSAPVSKELGAAALTLCATGGPLAGSNADSAVVDLFTSHLTSCELEPRSEWIVAEAALRLGKTEVLGQLLASPAEGSRRASLIKVCSHNRSMEDCVALFRACPEKSTAVYNSIMDACVEHKAIDLAKQFLDEAVGAKAADVVSYNLLIKAQLRECGTRRARETIEVMRKAGVEPNCVTFNELLDAAIKERPETVWSIVKEMQASGCRPNHVTCCIVLKSVSKASRASEVERAIEITQSSEDLVDEVLLSSICEACIRSGRTDLLAKQLERQRTIPIKGAHTFGSLIRSYSALGDLQGAQRAWAEMRRRGITPTSVTLGCMVEALASNGMVEDGYRLIREQMEDPETRPLVNAVIYCSVLKGFSHRKRFDRVWEVYEELRAHKLQCSVVTYNTLVDACARSSDMGRIPGLLEEMAQQGIEPNVITYSAIVKGYCQENRLDRAFELLADMKKNKDFRPDEVTYNTLIDGCARYGMFDRGLSVLEEMEAVGVPPSNFTLSVLVKLANRSRRPERAFELCDRLRKKYDLRASVHVYNNLIHACTAHGDYDKAWTTAERMFGERVKPDTRSYMLLLQAAVAEKSTNDVAGLLRAAGGLKGAHPRLLAAVGGSWGALKPQGGLTKEVVSQALEGVAGPCNDEALAAELLCDLRRAPGISIDPRLPMRLHSQGLGS